MKKLIMALALTASIAWGATRQEIVDHLQSVAVTIRAESDFSRSEGSGICKLVDMGGKKRCLVVTCAHVVDSLMKKTPGIGKDGKPKVAVTFKDASILRRIVEDGREVGEMKLNAQIIAFTEKHDVAILLVRSTEFKPGNAKFYLGSDQIPLGTKCLHVGSLLGALGSQSLTRGILSARGRMVKGQPYLQSDATIFPGSSGGLLAKESDGEVIAIIQRGAGEGFGLGAPVAGRVMTWAKKAKLEWVFDDAKTGPKLEEFKERIPVMGDGGKPALADKDKKGYNGEFKILPRVVPKVTTRE